LEEETKAYYNLPEDLMKEFHVEYIDGETNPEKIAEKCAERIQKEIDRFFK
jgi:predicted DNA-binding transcriptional regulator